MMFTQRSALAWFPAGCWVLTPAHKAPHGDLRGQSPASGFSRPAVPFAPPPHSQAYLACLGLNLSLLHSSVAMPQSSPGHREHGLLKHKARKKSSFLRFSLKRDKITNDGAQAGGLANISDIILPESARGSSVHFPQHYFIGLKIFKQ